MVYVYYSDGICLLFWYYIIQIINLVVSRQNWLIDSISKTKGVWYLPTSFAVFTTTDLTRSFYLFVLLLKSIVFVLLMQQYALGCRHTPQEVRKIFQKDFMPKEGQSVTKVVLCWFCLYDYFHIKIKASTELFFYFFQIFIPDNDQGVH